MNISDIRGFNYQPSYAYTGADIWRRFDSSAFERELGWGKKHFPGINGVRIWLAWEVFALGSDEEKEAFVKNVDTAFSIAVNLELLVMPVLFNRWHAGLPDWGGIYLDHFLPDSGWAGGSFDHQWRDYIKTLMHHFSEDNRIFSWDLCNEPFSYNFNDNTPGLTSEIEQYEYRWLKAVYELCKTEGACAPIGVGFWKWEHLKAYPELNDILNFHNYWLGDDSDVDNWLRKLDACVELREKTGKPLISTECCWGHVDDQERVRILEKHLSALNERNIGWLMYGLQHSLIADLHRPEYGPVSSPGTLHCVEIDGSLRPGHEAINKYV